MVVRFCVISFSELIEMNEDGSFKGFLAPLYHTYTDMLIRRFRNVTVTLTDTLGDSSSNTMNLTGCMGRLQRNESDVSANFIDYPIFAPGVRQSTFMFATKTTIVSVYFNQPTASNTDVMDAFRSFQGSLWTLTAMTALILALFLVISKHCPRIHGKKRDKRHVLQKSISLSSKVTIGNILKQHSSYNYDSKHLHESLIILLFAIFSFIMIFYFGSMIKTDMVVQKDPVTITTYDDIIDSGVRPLFVEKVNDDADFKNAGSNTKANQVWKLAQKHGLESCMISSDKDAISSFHRVAAQEAVWITSGYIADLLIKNVCPFMRAQGMYNEISALVKSDPTAREKVVGFPFSSSFSPVNSKKYLELTTSMLELGIVPMTLKSLEFVASPYSAKKEVLDCLANKIILPDHGFHTVPINHFSQLFLISGCLLISCLIILIMEVVRRKHANNSTSRANERISKAAQVDEHADSTVRSIALTK